MAQILSERDKDFVLFCEAIWPGRGEAIAIKTHTSGEMRQLILDATKVIWVLRKKIEKENK